MQLKINYVIIIDLSTKKNLPSFVKKKLCRNGGTLFQKQIKVLVNNINILHSREHVCNKLTKSKLNLDFAEQKKCLKS